MRMTSFGGRERFNSGYDYYGTMTRVWRGTPHIGGVLTNFTISKISPSTFAILTKLLPE